MNVLSESNRTHRRQMLRVLWVEDNAHDANLSTRQLEQAGFELNVDLVSSPQEFTAALRSNRYDIVLSDYALPGWSGMDALEVLRLTGEDIPFILLTGTLGEETAVECMKKGLTDYILKGRPGRLALAVKRALEERAARQREESAEALLHLRTSALEATANGVLITDRKGMIVWVNQAFSTLTGYTADEVIGQNPRILKSGHQDATFYRNLWKTILSGQVWNGEMVNRRKDGSIYSEQATITPVRNQQGEITHFVDIKQDITERKRAEEALRDSEERFRQLAENIQEVFWIADPGKNQMLYISPAYEKIWGRTRELLYTSPRNWLDAIHPEDREGILQAALTEQVQGTYNEQYRIVQPDGSIRWIHDRAFPVRNADGKALRVVGLAGDITERIQLETQLRAGPKDGGYRPTRRRHCP